MENSSTISLKNRYPGGKSFSEHDNQLFFGREKDLNDLTELLFVKESIVLFGKSGYGKSSLINAGIVPMLRTKNDWAYFPIRFNNYLEKEDERGLTPSETVVRRLSENISIDIDAEFADIIPNENSFWYWVKQNQIVKNKLKFIFFFDQFEELFTYPKEEIAFFSDQLSQLLYGVIPANFRRKIDELDDDELISDRLEELLYEKPEIKVIYSIRADRLSQMTVLTDKNPSILRFCYELDALTPEEAVTAITEPAKLSDDIYKSPVFEYQPDAVNKILQSIVNVDDGKIEAATLQIICRHVEENLVIANQLSLITEEDLGDITSIFQQYYESVLNKLAPSDRKKAQNLIEDELIDGERRNTLTENYIRNKFTISQNILDLLEQSSLLKKERDGKKRYIYEIGHDTIVTAVNRVASKRRALEEEERHQQLEKQRLEHEQSLKDRLTQEQTIASNLKRHVKRLRIAFVSLALLLLLICYLVFKWQQSEKNTKTIQQKKLAIESNFSKLQRDNSTKAAIRLMNAGDRSRTTSDYQGARHFYHQAFDSIKKYPTDTTFHLILEKLDTLEALDNSKNHVKT